MNHSSIHRCLKGERSSFEIIPLGTTCTISHYLRSHGLRITAFPFDWNVTPIQSAIELLGNGFSDFLSMDNLIFLPPTFRLLFDETGIEMEMKNDIITPAVCSKYNILFPHDFPQNHQASFAGIKRKYARRIARLKELLGSEKHLIFVHYNEDINNWQKEQYAQSLDIEFTNNYQSWMTDITTMLDYNYPGLSYSLINLDQLANIVNSIKN